MGRRRASRGDRAVSAPRVARRRVPGSCAALRAPPRGSRDDTRPGVTPAPVPRVMDEVVPTARAIWRRVRSRGKLAGTCGTIRRSAPTIARIPLSLSVVSGVEGKVTAMKTVKAFVAVLLALGVLTTASVALANKTAGQGQEVQAPRSQDVQAPRSQDIQAPRGQGVQAP